MTFPDLSQYPRLFGLIGYPLGHSFSKKYFAEKFRREAIAGSHYELFPFPSIDELPRLWERYPQLRGLNVTIPFKEQVLPWLTEVDTAAAAVGAVNTILLFGDQRVGYNTDIIGFEASLRRILRTHPAPVTAALVLGTGGAAKAVTYVLDRLDLAYCRISRTVGKGDLTYAQLTPEHLRQYPLLINTTPLGTYPAVDTCPELPYAALGPENILYDLVYNPEKTVFLKKGAAQGSTIQNGYEMLVGQAEAAWNIWTSPQPD